MNSENSTKVLEDVCPTGIDRLDELLKGGFPRRSVIVLVGHPGAGKTTFAAKFIYEGATRYGERGIYFSLGESKRKFYKNMKALGMDFEELERRGLFKFIQLPVAASQDFAEMFVELLTRAIRDLNAKRVVVDSITPVLSVLGSDKARAMLHTALYQGLTAMDVTAILIADLPYGKESLELGAVEFVADGVILMKTRIVEGLITRWLEIRKMRGRSIPLAEIPFSISEGVGIRVLAPPRIEDIPAPSMDTIYYTGCSLVDDAIGGIPKGSQILIIHPPGLKLPEELIIVILQFIAKNRLRTLFMSYSLPAEVIKQLFMHTMKMFGFEEPGLEQLLKIISINPTMYSIPELMSWMWHAVEQFNPDLVVVHGLRTIYDTHRYDETLTSHHLDTALLLRRRGITTLYTYAAKFPEEHVAPVEFCDVILVIVPAGDIKSEGKINFNLIIWNTLKGKPRTVLNLEDVKTCLVESILYTQRTRDESKS